MSLIDLTADVVSSNVRKTIKQPLRWLWFDSDFFVRMLAAFAGASPDETICWGSGPAIELDGSVLGWIERYWDCELEHTSRFRAKTDTKWLVKFAYRVQKEEPDHKVLVETHSHPIGSELSGEDANGLLALHDWSLDFYWVMVACDFQLGVHVVEDEKLTIRRIPWGVDGIWVERKQKESNKLETRINSTTSEISLAKMVLQKLRRQPMP